MPLHESLIMEMFLVYLGPVAVTVIHFLGYSSSCCSSLLAFDLICCWRSRRDLEFRVYERRHRYKFLQYKESSAEIVWKPRNGWEEYRFIKVCIEQISDSLIHVEPQKHWKSLRIKFDSTSRGEWNCTHSSAHWQTRCSRGSHRLQRAAFKYMTIDDPHDEDLWPLWFRQKNQSIGVTTSFINYQAVSFLFLYFYLNIQLPISNLSFKNI